MKIISKKENKISFSVELEESLANAIRRYVYQIPVLAIDEVEISKNDSPLYDETIAHRLGLVPLEPKPGKKEGHLKLSVDKEGTVYSGDLKGDAIIVYDKIPITVLNKGQELELSATTRFGKGHEHAKFSPGFMDYHEIVDIQIDKSTPKEIIDELPEEITKEGKYIVSDPVVWERAELYAEEAKKQGKEWIKVTPKHELVVSVESFGQINAQEIFKKAVEELKKDLHEVEKQVSKA